MRKSKYVVKNGEKYNHLLVIDSTLVLIKRTSAKRAQYDNMVKCKCDCGQECFVSPRSLILSQQKSCNCITRLGNSKYKIKIGDKFGKLTIIGKPFPRKIGNKKYNNVMYVRCKCECGNKVDKRVSRLFSKDKDKNFSCSSHCAAFKHGGRGTRLYSIYNGMIYRCKHANESKKYYPWINVQICEEWMDFINFKNWALNNGYNDKMTLHRKDNGNYCPKDCIWLDRKEHGKTITSERDKRIKELEEENKLLKEKLEKYENSV